MLTISHHPANSDPAAVQRWRSITAYAVFKGNNAVQSRLHEEISSRLEHILKDTYLPSPEKRPKSKSIYRTIVHRVERSLLDVVRQSRKLSFMLHQVTSYRVIVTVTSSTETNLNIPYSFGLKKLTEQRHFNLIEPNVLLSTDVQSYFPTTV